MSDNISSVFFALSFPVIDADIFFVDITPLFFVIFRFSTPSYAMMILRRFIDFSVDAFVHYAAFAA